MIEKLWEFSDAQALPSATTVIATKIIDWSAAGSQYLDMMNSGMELWVVVMVNTVPTGTSAVVKCYQHSTTTITSGDLLDTGDIRAVAYMSANAQSIHHILYARELSGLLASAMAFDGTTDRYFGLAYTAVGNCTDGKVDAWLQVGKPVMPTTQVNTSNIT